MFVETALIKIVKTVIKSADNLVVEVLLVVSMYRHVLLIYLTILVV
jgi:hypothetical protein